MTRQLLGADDRSGDDEPGVGERADKPHPEINRAGAPIAAGERGGDWRGGEAEGGDGERSARSAAENAQAIPWISAESRTPCFRNLGDRATPNRRHGRAYGGGRAAASTPETRRETGHG